MSEQRIIYKSNGYTAYIRKHKGTYEARVRQLGVQATICGKSVQVVKERLRSFTAQLKASERKTAKSMKSAVTPEYCVGEWLKKKSAVQKASTYKMTLYAFNKHCLDLVLSSATSVAVQSRLSELPPRAALYAYTLLSDYYETATELSGIVNPMKNVKRPVYEAPARPRATQFQIVNIFSTESKLASGAKLCLCTGMRRGEIFTARVKDGFIWCVTEKTRRGARERQRKIPVLDERVPEWLEEASKMSADALSRSMAEICQGLRLHDLRHAFASICKESGVLPEVVAVWLGHELPGTTGRVYTHYSDEFMLAEAKKLKGKIPPNFPPNPD